MPRFKNRDVLVQAIRTGAASRDFFGTAYGQHDGTFDGFQFGSDRNVQLDDTLLLIEPEAARLYEEAEKNATKPKQDGFSNLTPQQQITTSGAGPGIHGVAPATAAGPARSRLFHGTAEVSPATAKMRLVQIADEIVSVLGSDPNASVRVVVEISAEFPDGAKDSLKRAVSENARTLGLKSADWE